VWHTWLVIFMLSSFIFVVFFTGRSGRWITQEVLSSAFILLIGSCPFAVWIE
jgi:hypothetical protein